MLKRLCIVAAAALCLAVAIVASKARDLGQWEDADPGIQAWYRTLMQPDNPHISCCGKADAWWADKLVVRDGKMIAVITDNRDDAPLGRRHIANGTEFEIPAHKIVRRHTNPTGHTIIFINSAGDVLCYVMTTLT